MLAGPLRLGLVAGVGSQLAAQAPQAAPLFALAATAMVATDEVSSHRDMDDMYC